MNDDIIDRLKWDVIYDNETLIYQALGIYPSTNNELLQQIIDKFEKEENIK